jgi:hypothetical protein
MVKGGSEVCKFPADHEQHPAKSDLYEVRQRCVKYYPAKNAQINPGPVDMTETFFAANKVDRGPDWRQVNNDRANLSDRASCEGRQDRDAMTLYHSTPDCSLEVAYVP